MAKVSRFERLRSARIALVQAMFVHNFSPKPIQNVRNVFLEYFFEDEEITPISPERSHFIAVMSAFQANQTKVQDFLESIVQGNWSLTRMDPTLVAILQAGASELLTVPLASPAPVIVSDYVDIAKGFFDREEKSFVNKSLDLYAQNLGHPMRKG